MITNKLHLRGYLYLLLSQLSLSINIVCSKVLLRHMRVLNLVWIRFLLAAILLFILHWCWHPGFRRKSQKKIISFRYLNQRDWIYFTAQSLCAGLFFSLLSNYGIYYANANIAGIIMSALPAVIILFAVMFLKECLSAAELACVACAVCGLVVISTQHASSGSTYTMIGILLLCVALIPEAAYYTLIKKHPIKTSALLSAAMLSAINVLCAFIIMLIMHVKIYIPAYTQHWALLLLLGLVSGLFYVFWFLGSRVVSGSTAGIMTAFMPIGTLILSRIFLGENLGVFQLLGMILIIFSIIIYAKKVPQPNLDP